MDEVIGQSADNGSAPVNSAPESSAPAEKTLRQSEVNDIVGRAKQEAASRAVEQYKRSQESQQPQHQERTPSDSYMSEDRIRKMAAEEAQKLRENDMREYQTRTEAESAQRVVKNFFDKMAAGKDKYEDFEKVTGDLELARFPNTVHMLAEFVDNPHDVMYELSKNRAKMAQLEMTAKDFPQEALYDLKRLAESIKSNEVANTRRIPNAPLSQQRPSNVGTDAGNTLSMRDLKAKYRA
jgi:hypothetical protein